MYISWLTNLLPKRSRQNKRTSSSQVSVASEFAIIIATTAVLPTMHSDNMQNNNNKRLPFAALTPTSKMELQREQFEILQNLQESNCYMPGQDGQNAFI